MAAISFGFLGTAVASDDEHAADEHLGGKALKEENEAQIKSLEAKREELKKAGGDTSVIDELIKLNARLVTVGDQRHIIHGASEQFAKAIDAFSKDLEADMQAMNEVLGQAADGAINNAKTAENNAKIAEIIGKKSASEDEKKAESEPPSEKPRIDEEEGE